MATTAKQLVPKPATERTNKPAKFLTLTLLNSIRSAGRRGWNLKPNERDSLARQLREVRPSLVDAVEAFAVDAALWPCDDAATTFLLCGVPIRPPPPPEQQNTPDPEPDEE